MKFLFDVDGVIPEAPAFFTAVSRAPRAAGHEGHVVSDFDEHFREQRVRELAAYGVEYDAFAITANKAADAAQHWIDVAVDDDAAEYFPGQLVVPRGLAATRTA